MNAEFFDAVADIEKEKGIPREYMYEKIRQAMLTAFRKDTPDCEDNVEVILDEDKKKIEMVVKKTVVARVIDPYVEISEEAAHRISKRAKIGDVVSVPRQIGRDVVFDLHPARRDRGKDQQRGKHNEKQPVMVDDPFRCTVQRGRFLVHNGITTPYPDKNAGVDFLITEG